MTKDRKVASLVQKWQTVKAENRESSSAEDTDDEEDRRIAKWRKEQLKTGTTDNANFMVVTGDWRKKREDLLRKRETAAAAVAVAAASATLT